ncbi:hypothetical protein ACP70R_030756 [Stipagrostis hirtigluma subsp. patula]
MAGFRTLLLSTLLLFALIMGPSVAGFDEYVDADGGFLLLDCGRSSPHMAAAGSKNSSAANLGELLAALPSVAAPQGFAVLSRGGASVRGVCVGDGAAAQPEGCRACLAAAARNVTSGCGGLAGRRGGAWSDACFLAFYADAGAAAAPPGDDRRRVLCGSDFPSSYLDNRVVVGWWPTRQEPTLSLLADELAQRAAGDAARMHAAGDMRSPYSYSAMTVYAVAQCAKDRGAAACATCLQAAALQATLSCPAEWTRGGRVASDGCYLRFEVTVEYPDSRSGDSAGGRRSWVVIGGAFAAAAALLG